MWKTLCYEEKGGMGDNPNPIQEKTLSVVIDDVNIICMSSGDINSDVSSVSAELIVSLASKFIGEKFDELYALQHSELKGKVFSYLLENLKEKSNEDGFSLDDFATSLSLVAVKGVKFISCFIGDGIIANYKDGKITVLNSKVSSEAIFLTDSNALSSFKVDSGNLKGVRGFIMMNAGTLKGFYLDHQLEFDEIVGVIVSTVGSITSDEMNAHIKQVFDNFVVHKTDLNCSIAVMSTRKCASRYYALSYEEKVVLLKLSTNDSNSVERVRDLDNILNLIQSGKSAAELSSILNIDEVSVKKKLEILVKNNILSLSKNDVYKKID